MTGHARAKAALCDRCDGATRWREEPTCGMRGLITLLVAGKALACAAWSDGVGSQLDQSPATLQDRQQQLSGSRDGHESHA